MSIHLGIIPDGNRRYCKKHHKSLSDMIEDSFETHCLAMLDYIYKISYSMDKKSELFHIKEISFYMLSADNLIKRGEQDLQAVFLFFNKVYDYFIKCLEGVNLDQRSKTHAILLKKVHIQFVGELKQLPNEISQKIDTIHKKFSGGDNPLRITIAIAYDPIQDLKGLCAGAHRAQTPIDLIIRTSGEKRLSGFFPYHSLYSELFFIEKLWPEFTIQDLEDVIHKFHTRNRRFGK